MSDAAEAALPVSAVSDTGLWKRSLLWLLFLGPFFFLSYGYANSRAALSAVATSVVFAWETAIPLLPWTIVPYWSIDLLYGLAFLLCTSARQVDRLALRLLTAQLVSVACFLLFPLRFAVERPPLDGMFGWLFELLAGFDEPYNQAPSLHIGLLVILWARFAAGRRGLALLCVHAWAMLIGLSVLTTYQHHFIDVPTGALVGALCLWLWPDEEQPALATWRLTRDPRRRQLAVRYLAAAAALGAVAAWQGGAALWLLWGSVALALSGLCYLGFGAAGLQKTQGRLSVGAGLLLAPCIAGAWLNSRLWTWRRPAPDHIADGVHVGRLPGSRSMRACGFAGLVDLSAELPAPRGPWHYTGVPLLDLVVPTPRQLHDAAHAIEQARRHGPLLVCCALGYSRSACAVAAWLVLTGRSPDVDHAIGALRRQRPQVVLGPEHRAALHAFADTLRHAHAA